MAKPDQAWKNAQRHLEQYHRTTTEGKLERSTAAINWMFWIFPLGTTLICLIGLCIAASYGPYIFAFAVFAAVLVNVGVYRFCWWLGSMWKKLP